MEVCITSHGGSSSILPLLALRIGLLGINVRPAKPVLSPQAQLHIRAQKEVQRGMALDLKTSKCLGTEEVSLATAP